MDNQNQPYPENLTLYEQFWMNDIIMSRKKKQIYWKTWKTYNIKQYESAKKFQELVEQIRLKQLIKQLIECIKQYELVKKFQELVEKIRLKQLIEHIKQFANDFTDLKLIKAFDDFKVYKYHESSTAQKQNFTQRAQDFYNNPLNNQVDSISKKQNFKNYKIVIQNYLDRKQQLINKINNLKINPNININNLSEIDNNNWREIKKYLTDNTSRGAGNNIKFTQNEATVLRRIIRFVLNRADGYINDYIYLSRNIELLGPHSILVAGIYDTNPCIYCNNHLKIKGLAHCGICKRK